jgi:hypothetical protein
MRCQSRREPGDLALMMDISVGAGGTSKLGYAAGLPVGGCSIFDAIGNPAACQASQPPIRARALVQPACLSSCATRALVASCGQAQ